MCWRGVYVSQAAGFVAEALRKNPQLSLEVFRQRLPFKDPGIFERIGDALRKAGLK